MSLSKQKDVRHLVEKYRREFSSLERPLLRRIIRSENKIENPSELKKLDRYLAKAFQNEVELSKKSTTEKPSDDYEKYVKELKEIGRIALVSPDHAWGRFTVFRATLPTPLKKEVDSIWLPIAENKTYNDRLALKIGIDRLETFFFKTFRDSSE